MVTAFDRERETEFTTIYANNSTDSAPADRVIPPAGRSRVAVDHLEADALVALTFRLGLEHTNSSHLVGGPHVGAAVGLFVEPDDVDDADLRDRLRNEVHLGADQV